MHLHADFADQRDGILQRVIHHSQQRLLELALDLRDILELVELALAKIGVQDQLYQGVGLIVAIEILAAAAGARHVIGT